MSKNLIVALGAYLTVMTFSTFSMDNDLEKAVKKQLAEYGSCTVFHIDNANGKLGVTFFKKNNPTIGPLSFSALNKTDPGKEIIKGILSEYEKRTF